MGAFFYRVMGAVMLDAGMYETIEHDRRTTRQAFSVVLLASIAAAVGSSHAGPLTLNRVAIVAGSAMIIWVAWAVLILRIGGRHLPERGTRVTLGELMRTIGFAAAPGWLQVFAIFREVALPVLAISWAWIFVAMIVAVKHALDYHTIARAIFITAFALALVVGFALLISAAFGPVTA